MTTFFEPSLLKTVAPPDPPAYIKGFLQYAESFIPMGKQYNKGEKRRRRLAYNDRLKQSSKAARKPTPRAKPKPAPKKSPAAAAPAPAPAEPVLENPAPAPAPEPAAPAV